MSVIATIKPYTRWNLLDYVIMQLGVEGDRICTDDKVARVTDDQFYNALINLVCRHEVSSLKDLVVEKPFYPYILLTYYILFFKGDYESAKALFTRILAAWRRYPRMFDEDEDASVRILEEVMKFFDALKEADVSKHRELLTHHLEILTKILMKSQCVEGGWSCLFKSLILSHLDVNLEQPSKLQEDIAKTCASEFIIDEELIYGYNLFIDKLHEPICTFMQGVIRRRLEEVNTVRNKIQELEMKKEQYKKILLDPLIRVQKIIRIEDIKNMLILLSILSPFGVYIISRRIDLSLIPLIIPAMKFASEVFKYIIKRIEKKIERLKAYEIEKIARILWHSQEPHSVLSLDKPT